MVLVGTAAGDIEGAFNPPAATFTPSGDTSSYVPPPAPVPVPVPPVYTPPSQPMPEAIYNTPEEPRYTPVTPPVGPTPEDGGTPDIP